MVTSLSWRSAIVVLFQSMMPASNLRWRLTWFQESVGQLFVENVGHAEASYVFFAVSGVFAGLTSASVRKHRKKGFAFAGCRELASEIGRVSERTVFKRSFRSIRARSRVLRSTSPEVGCNCPGSDEDEMALALKGRADFPEVSLQLLFFSE